MRKSSRKRKKSSKKYDQTIFLHALNSTKKTRRKLKKKIKYSYKIWKRLTRRYRKNLFSGIVTIAGFILIWRGIWYLADSIPPLENPIVSILLGLGLLLFLGARAMLFEF